MISRLNNKKEERFHGWTQEEREEGDLGEGEEAQALLLSGKELSPLEFLLPTREMMRE